MKTLDRTTVDHYAERLSRITSDTKPGWGSLRPETLMSHLRRILEVSLEEQSLPDYPMPLSKTVLFRWLMIHLPWPKGARSPETLFPDPEGDLDTERRNLIDAMRRFAEALARDPKRRTRSPLLGPITLQDWARLHARHLEHHLKQFGH